MPSAASLSASRSHRLKRALVYGITLFVLAAAASLTRNTTSAAQTVTLTGAGATFPQPIYEKWFAEYNRLHPEVRINYQGIGSGGGIRAIQERQVDFGASDAFLSDDELKSMSAKILHIPTVAGAVVVTYNLPGNPKLQLTPDILVDIFLGKITRWNDPRLAAINTGIRLPSLPISVVHRSDGSGTTHMFTTYLSAVSKEWATKVGADKSVAWPVEAAAGKGNPGVAAYVRQLPGAIGYVELAYAKQNNLPHAALRNAAGHFVTASVETIKAAMATANMPADFRATIVNAPGAGAYPIAGFTWLLIYEKQTDPVKGKALVDVIEWALKNGDAAAESLDYVPLPDSLQEKVLRALDNVQF